MSTNTSRPAVPADIEIKVYDLAMRMLQLEVSMQIGAAVSHGSRQLIKAASADSTHPLHHRAFAFQRLEAVMAALQVEPRSLTPVARQRSFFWRSMFYPAAMMRSQLAQVIATTSSHPSEVEHRSALLMDALADAEAEMSTAQARAMSLSELEISRAAARGAAIMAAAGWIQSQSEQLCEAQSAQPGPKKSAEPRFNLAEWIANENRAWQDISQDRTRERA